MDALRETGCKSVQAGMGETFQKGDDKNEVACGGMLAFASKGKNRGMEREKKYFVFLARVEVGLNVLLSHMSLGGQKLFNSVAVPHWLTDEERVVKETQFQRELTSAPLNAEPPTPRRTARQKCI